MSIRILALLLVTACAACAGARVGDPSAQRPEAAPQTGDQVRPPPEARASEPADAEASARAVLEPFLAPGADHAALSAALRPTRDDYRAVFGEASVDRLVAVYEPAWERREIIIRPKDGQTELALWSATTEELQQSTSAAAEFPGGYKKVAGRLQPGLRLYRFKFLAPGADAGMAFDGLVQVGGRWVIIPKPWRAFEE